MHGEKLHFVKQAAAHEIDLMREEDSVTVVTYDDSVQTLASSQSLTQKVKAEIKAKIMGVETGSSTFLYGGWLAGCRSVAERATDYSFSRTLLLTDGLANVGERRMGPLSIHAQELFMRGISTSCFGVGSDYDEHLLGAMANLGGGNFHFLETVNAIPLVFEREFDEIINVVFRDVKIELTLPESVEVAVSANWHSKRERDRLTIYLGSMTADQALPVYIQLTNSGSGAKESLFIPVNVKGKDSEQVNHEAMSTIRFKAVPEAEETAAQQDSELMKRFAVVDLADKANEALKREREGDRVGSSQIMQDSLSLHSPSIPKSVQEKYQKLSDDMRVGLDPLERKRHHYQEYESSRSRQSIRHYYLSSDTDLLLARIEGHSVLIHTGLPVSLGVMSDWWFLDTHYSLASEFNRMSCKQVSQVLGLQVDVLLGMDILKDLYVQIDPGQNVVEFSRQSLRYRGWQLALKENDGIPTCQVPIEGVDVDMRLMTVSRLCYVPAGMASGWKPVGQVNETLIGFDAFDTPLYRCNIQQDKNQMSLSCGVLPEAIRKELSLGTQEGILGASFLKNTPSTLALPEGKLVILM